MDVVEAVLGLSLADLIQVFQKSVSAEVLAPNLLFPDHGRPWGRLDRRPP
jgi:hypothetical protein